MTKPSLTLSIPFHNGIDFLRAAVASVLAQDDPAWQLIVCDDSEPQDGELRAYLEGLSDARIRYHRNRAPSGMVANWNLPFELADTELLCLLHQDDCLLTGYVSLMRGLAEAHTEVSAFYAGARIIDGQGKACFSFADWIKRFLKPRAKHELLLEGERALEALLRGNFIMCPTLCFRRASLGELRFDARWKQVQDLDLLCRLLIEGHHLLGSPKEVYAYRRHGQAATSLQSESLLRFEEECALLDEMATRSAALGWERAARIARAKRIVRLHLGYRILGDLLGLRGTAAAQKWRFLRRMI